MGSCYWKCCANRRVLKFALLSALAAGALGAQTFRIYAIDVEGGKSTLYVSPSGESMLLDAGYDDNNNRDADRILAAAHAAGIQRIDNLVISHFHGDHIGGVPQLAAKIQIGKIYDHGTPVVSDKNAIEPFEKYAAERAKHTHVVVHPGDTIPVAGLDVRVVAAAEKTIDKPLPGAGQPNPLCSAYQPMQPMSAWQENEESIALVITYGNLRVADFGDLYWNIEHELACPVNKIGAVDILMTSHHGDGSAGTPQMIHAMHPRVAIMNNGPERAGQSFENIRNSPGLQDIWQLHTTIKAADRNPPPDFIANRPEDADGKWIEASAQKDGTFTVRNQRNQFEKTYKK